MRRGIRTTSLFSVNVNEFVLLRAELYIFDSINLEDGILLKDDVEELQLRLVHV